MRKQKTIFLGVCFLLIAVLIPSNKTRAEEELERTDPDYPVAGEEFENIDNFQEPLIAPMPYFDDTSSENMIDTEANIEAGVIGIENAQEISEEEIAELEKNSEEEIESDENITAEDLGINDPTVLSDRKILYPIKNMWRNILVATTFSPIKKANLRLRFASEKLIEAKKIADKTDNPEIIEKAIDNYKDAVDRISDQIGKIKEKAKDNTDVDALVGKIADNQIKHNILIDKLEKNLSEETVEKIHLKINAAREQALEKLFDSTLEIADVEKMKEKLEKAIDKQGESEFRGLRHIEILKRVEENAPEQAKEALQKVIEKAQTKFEEKMQNLGEKDQKIFQYYIKNMSGNEIRHLEIINNVEGQEISNEVRDIMEQAKEQAIKKIEIKIDNPRSEEEKEKLLSHLKEGKMEDMRILKELENSLPPETIEKISNIKNTAMDNFKAKIENISPEKQEEIKKEIEKFHDVKQLEILNDLGRNIPEDRKEFLNKIKENAKEKIKKDIENAQDAVQKTLILKKLAGDTTESIGILEEYIPDKTMIQEITQEQIKKIERKATNIQDPERLQIIKEQIQENSQVSNMIKAHTPNIINQLQEKEDRILNNISEDEANKIREKEMIRQEERIEKQEQNINIGLANPAAVYCEKNGGKLIPTQTTAGSDALCAFPDGTKCEQWAFYRGECRRTVETPRMPQEPIREQIQQNIPKDVPVSNKATGSNAVAPDTSDMAR